MRVFCESTRAKRQCERALVCFFAHGVPALLALVGLCHNMIMAVKMVSDLHQGTGASDLFCERWKRKSANPSTKTPSLGATATNLFDGSGVNNEDFLEYQTMETSKTKELTPNLMRTFIVLLDQIVDVTCPCTSVDTLDAAPAANALDSTPLDLACKKGQVVKDVSLQWELSGLEGCATNRRRFWLGPRLVQERSRRQTDAKLGPESRSTNDRP